MTVHRIRLMGPWEFLWQERSRLPASHASGGTVRLPQTWQSLFGLAAGIVSFTRKFHRPTNLEAHERVFLVLMGVRGAGRAVLNGSDLGEFAADGTAVEFDILERLQAFNVLSIEIEFAPDSMTQAPGGLFEPVVLEIRSHPDQAARLAEAAMATKPTR